MTIPIFNSDLAISAVVIDSRLQPMVPIAFVSGHVSPAARMAEFHAFLRRKHQWRGAHVMGMGMVTDMEMAWGARAQT